MSYLTRRLTNDASLAEGGDRADHNSSARLMSRLPARGLLRIEEAAEWLGLSKRKTYELVSRGELPSLYIGRSRRIALTALESYVERLATEPGRG